MSEQMWGWGPNRRCDCDGYRPDTEGVGTHNRADGRFENLNSGKD